VIEYEVLVRAFPHVILKKIGAFASFARSNIHEDS
jgi:hypothetical protein